jgi:hypothetical protein
MQALGRSFVIALLCFAIGLHWYALQSIAWTTMVVKYARNCPLQEAFAKTFDGEHPCSLCHAVQNGKKSEQKGVIRGLTKIDLCSTAAGAGDEPNFIRLNYPIERTSFISRIESPPSPPPRPAV